MRKMSEFEYQELSLWWHDNYHYDGPDKYYEDCFYCQQLVDEREKGVSNG